MSKRLCFVLALFLTACGVQPTRPVDDRSPQAVYDQRAAYLGEVSAWTLVGKLSMDDGEEGGSGRLSWRSAETLEQLDFHGALGRGAWRLDISPDRAVLKKSDGSQAAAPSVNELIQDEIGWRIPVDSLRWWVIGMAAPGEVDAMELDESGLPVHIQQHGWSIDFERFGSADGVQLPRRLEAVSGRYRVKLAIARWTLASGGEGGE